MKFSAFMDLKVSILIRARHWFLFWVRCIQSTPSHPISWRSILILYSIYAEVFRVVSSLRVYRPKLHTHSSSLPCVLHALTISYSLIWSH